MGHRRPVGDSEEFSLLRRRGGVATRRVRSCRCNENSTIQHTSCYNAKIPSGHALLKRSGSKIVSSWMRQEVSRPTLSPRDEEKQPQLPEQLSSLPDRGTASVFPPIKLRVSQVANVRECPPPGALRRKVTRVVSSHLLGSLLPGPGQYFRSKELPVANRKTLSDVRVQDQTNDRLRWHSRKKHNEAEYRDNRPGDISVLPSEGENFFQDEV